MSTVSAEGTSSWAAVLIDDVWRLVDVNWGARHMVGGGSDGWVLVDNNGVESKGPEAGGPAATKYACDESYFLTDPYQFIYSHIPGEDVCFLVVACTQGMWEKAHASNAATLVHVLLILTAEFGAKQVGFCRLKTLEAHLRWTSYDECVGRALAILRGNHFSFLTGCFIHYFNVLQAEIANIVPHLIK